MASRFSKSNLPPDRTQSRSGSIIRDLSKSAIQVYHKGNPRLRLLLGLYPLCFLFLILGLGWRQVIQYKDYQQREESQSLRRILQPGPRGDIFDRHGRLLVGNEARFSAVLYLSDLRGELNREFWKNVNLWRERSQGSEESLTRDNYNTIMWQSRTNVLQRYLDQINQLLGSEDTFSVTDIRRTFDPRSMLPFPLKRDLTLEEYAILTEWIAPESPIQIYSETTRFYPYGSAAAHTLGYVTSTYELPEQGVPGQELTTISYRGKVGKAGLELEFNDALQGDSGGQVWKVNHAGYQYALLESKRPQPGENLRTSLDVDLQMAAEDALGNRTGAVVAIEVQTGEVLVLASKPDYDLNSLTPFISNATYNAINEQGAWLNRATQGLYPPGSTFKLITALAALNQGKIDPQQTIHCGGTYMVGNRAFPCWNRSGHGELNLQQALEKSCNVYFYQIGVDTGINALAEQARQLGFDEKTGIDLPFETHRMLVPDPAWKRQRDLGGWVGGDTANMSIGQGFVLLTPLQMATFTASLARRAAHTRPTLIHTSTNQATLAATDQPLAITDAHYEALLRGMEASSQSGTARLVQIPGLRIASKTGTAQVRIPGDTLTLAWYVGFAPLDNPQIAVAVLVEGLDPSDRYAGGQTAAPVARAVYQQYFQQNE